MVVLAPREAINETERRLCGSGAVSRPAVAEGFALQGRRAATLIAPATAGPLGSDSASAAVAWVHHRCGPAVTSGFSFELAASITQDAVDHCLVAHDLAQRIGAPGLCTLAEPPFGSLDRVSLPDDALVNAFDQGRAARNGSLIDSDESVLAAAAQAFRRVSELTHRPISTITVDGPQDADFALIASGEYRLRARQLADALKSDGIRCRVICTHLVRPFPAAELSRAVADIKRLLLIPGGDGFLEATRRAMIAGGLTATPVLLESLGSEEAINAAAQAFGLLTRAGGANRRQASAGAALGLAAQPTGGWAERFLLNAAARLEMDDPIVLAAGQDLLVAGRHPVRPAADLPIGLALCAHPSYVETPGLLLRLAEGATLVIVSAGPLPDDWWEHLAHETRALLIGLDVRVHWIDLSAATSVDLADPEAVRTVMLDGFMAAGAAAFSEVLELRIDTARAPRAMTRVAVASLELARVSREHDFKPHPHALPRMPAEHEDTEEIGWRNAARRFHLTGTGANSRVEPTLAEPLHPLVFDAIDMQTRHGASYPVLVGAEAPCHTDIAVAFESRAREILGRLAEGEGVDILKQYLPRLSGAVGRAVSRNRGPVDPGPVIATGLCDFERGLDLSDAGRTALRTNAEALRRELDTVSSGHKLIGLDETTLPCLHAAAIRSARRERSEHLLAEIGSLVRQLEDLIAIDDGHDPQHLSAEALGSTLGADASTFFDPQELAANLQRQRGPKRLVESRRRRIERALATLRQGLDGDAGIDVILVRPAGEPGCSELPGVREIVHPRGLGAAIGLFDGLAATRTDLFRALRVARLEVDEAYDPVLHDEPLARLEWQGLSEDELLSLPRLVVLENDARLRGAGLGALAELLRSGRPVHVLVTQSTSEFRTADSWQGLGGFHPGLGYLAVAHREAFVVESSLVAPQRLICGLQKMAASLRPGVAVVAVPAWNATTPPWFQLLAAEQARAIPCFTYDPESGPNWAQRFDLGGNPQPDRPWPVHTVRYADAQGQEATLEQAFTFAHAVAFNPAFRSHFRIVPDQAWSAEQMELSDYLDAPVAVVTRRIPFIWVVTENRLARALVTRELAYASRDRLRAWHILQELAGTDNEHLRKAAKAARIDTQTIAEPQESEAGHAQELDRARGEAVRTAMERLARKLVGLDPAPPSTPSPVVEETTEVPGVSAETVEQATVPEEHAENGETSALIEDAYIDSMLCTSCADCININPRLFKYDANKQAFIDDAAAGTYVQLVKAAEKCPACCIHPGLPPAGDKTANDTWVARAAKFN